VSTGLVFGLLLLILGHAATVQSEEGRQIKSCPILTDAEAATVLGPGTIFVSGVEGMSGKVRISLLCEWVQNERTLKVQATKTLGDRAVWETMRTLSNGTLEPGLGDYAYSAVDEGKPTMVIVKAPLTLDVVVGGRPVSSADLPKVKEAAKKAASKLWPSK
jgi:hypothetical protein